MARAGWWWVDRWRKSTAYTDMSLAAQGAYRNLLDELWLRDGVLPNEERILAKISGDAVEWPSVRDAVMARFYLTAEGWRASPGEMRLCRSPWRRPDVPLQVRRDVFERDGFACVFCGETHTLELDHILRYRDGGQDTVENLRVLCLPCNRRRG